MEYRVIDRNNWQRKEYFEHYLKEVPCTYSITTKLDITAIKKQRLKLYPTMLYYITKTVNRYEQFRTAFRTDGTLVIYNEMLPCYTVFHQDTKASVNKGYKRDKIQMRGDKAEMSDFPLYLNTVAGGLDCRNQAIGGFSLVVKR